MLLCHSSPNQGSIDIIIPVTIYRYRYICLAPYQTDTDTDNRFKPILTDYLQVLFQISIPISTIPIPIPIILIGFISNRYRYLYRFVRPIPIRIIGIGIGYTDLADYWSNPTLQDRKHGHLCSCSQVYLAVAALSYQSESSHCVSCRACTCN